MQSTAKNVSPAFNRWRRHRFLFGSLWVAGFALVAVVSAWLYIKANFGNGVIPAFAAVLFLLSLSSVISSLQTKARIVPYFEQPVAGPSTYLMGAALYRNSAALDQYLIDQHLTPISAFNSGDDFRREPLTWYAADEALTSVRALAAAASDGRLAIVDPSLKSDLELLKQKLEFVVEKGVRFCLLVQDSDLTNGMEHEQRKGTFFETDHRIVVPDVPSPHQSPPVTPAPDSPTDRGPLPIHYAAPFGTGVSFKTDGSEAVFHIVPRRPAIAWLAWCMPSAFFVAWIAILAQGANLSSTIGLGVTTVVVAWMAYHSSKHAMAIAKSPIIISADSNSLCLTIPNFSDPIRETFNRSEIVSVLAQQKLSIRRNTHIVLVIKMLSGKRRSHLIGSRGTISAGQIQRQLRQVLGLPTE